jgi:hypothetical protein
MLLGSAVVRFAHRVSGVSAEQRAVRLASPPEGPGLLRWDESEEVSLDPRELAGHGDEGAQYGDLAPGLDTARGLNNLSKDFVDYVYRNVKVSVLQNSALKLYSSVGESETDFEARCKKAADEAYDEGAAALQKQYETRLKRIDDKLEREKRELAQDETDLAARTQDEVLSAGETLLGLFSGRKLSTAVSKASRKRGQTSQAKADVEESKQAIAALEKERQDLQDELEKELEALRDQWDDVASQVETVEISPSRTDVSLELFGIGWRPVWEIGYDDGQGRTVKTRTPAFAGSE